MELRYNVSKDEFAHAGEASSNLKKVLKQLGISAELIRKIAIAMYEAEINMVIHADGGTIDVNILPEKIYIALKDTGPGIPDIEKAMQEGFSTASDEVRNLGFGAGMGFPNMKKNSDFIKVSSEVGVGTVVELEIGLLP